MLDIKKEMEALNTEWEIIGETKLRRVFNLKVF